MGTNGRQRLNSFHPLMTPTYSLLTTVLLASLAALHAA